MGAFAAIDFVMHEAALFAAAGFLLLGLSDLAVDLLWIGLKLGGRTRAMSIDDLPMPAASGRLAIFVPAWDEAGIIEHMLAEALARFDHSNYLIYVGCYPNDPATIAAISGVGDPRIRLVIGPRDGPTTKADCLNTLWRAMVADEAALGPARAVILHDAEDVVHPAELRLFDALIDRAVLVQTPVLPLPRRHSRWVSGHYLDEFAEAHGKEMVVRSALGVGLPSAGVGCAFRRDALAAVAGPDGPFDADSLTEDYELGLKLRRLGRALFVRCRDGAGGLVVTREYFPATVETAVRQKGRWMTGIALAGWDRLGWSGGPVERWMRMRDRQSLLASLLLTCGYTAFFLLAFVQIGGAFGYRPEPVPPLLSAVLTANLLLLAWRLVMRAGFTAATYGLVEGVRAIPRMIVSNMIAILAAERALSRYRMMRRDGVTVWDKTQHAFPDAAAPAE